MELSYQYFKTVWVEGVMYKEVAALARQLSLNLNVKY